MLSIIYAIAGHLTYINIQGEVIFIGPVECFATGIKMKSRDQDVSLMRVTNYP